jgi:SAM-dependent methyltransferase
MGKQDQLTGAELSAFTLSSAVLAVAEHCRVQTGRPRCAIRILDFGCGRGRSVARLREIGFDAFGYDASAEVVKKGYDLFRAHGWAPETTLRAGDPSGQLPFARDFFHVVFSEQVLEHVQNIDVAASEISRVTCERGTGWHVCSAPYRVVEEHLHMPFIHWLPKNHMRKWFIRLLVGSGSEPCWPELAGKTIAQKTEVYYRYSMDKTFYRSWPAIRASFARVGLKAHAAMPGGTSRSGVLSQAAYLTAVSIAFKTKKAGGCSE